MPSLSSLKILAIETTQEACSVALKVGDTLFEHTNTSPREHARLLLPTLHQLLQEAELTVPDLQVLALSCGPGSFTGVRIGAAFIQGLSFGLGKPVVLVSTLRAAAQAAYRINNTPHVFATLDARMNEIYWGLYAVDENGIMQSQSKESVQNPNEIPNEMMLSEGLLSQGSWVKSSVLPLAQDVAKIAAAEYMLGHVVYSEGVQPVYLRNEVVKK